MVHERLVFLLTVALLVVGFFSMFSSFTGYTVSSYRGPYRCGDYEAALSSFARNYYDADYDLNKNRQIDKEDLRLLFDASQKTECPVQHTCVHVGSTLVIEDRVLHCTLGQQGKRTLSFDNTLNQAVLL